MLARGSVLVALSLAAGALAQGASSANSFPHVYPGQPSGDYSTQWQSYFQVKDPLPNVTFTLGRSFAGNIGVNREKHPNDTLFFWAFEKSNGSLTASANSSNDPWGIWLNGGPGSSSMVGLHFENGPIHIQSDYSAVKYSKSWDQIADYIWVDQPCGVGFSTADADGTVADEDQMGTDFVNFLANLVKVFPSLGTRPLHLTGESYAGTYIPYITKAIFSTPNPPVNLAKIAIGDGTVGSGEVFELLPVTQVLETYPQIIGYSTEAYQYFKEQEHLCGYDLNLTYPQNGSFPPLKFVGPAGGPSTFSPSRGRSRLLTKSAINAELASRYRERKSELQKRDRVADLESWKRDLSGRPNGTIDPTYGCDLLDEMMDYAFNFSYPWVANGHASQAFDVYDVPDGLAPEAAMDASVFLNDNRTRAAIHAPTSKDWQESISYDFRAGQGGQDPSPEPMAFLNELAANATQRGVGVVLYYGNDDSLVPHAGGQVVIQNTTFGGIQGFTRPPSTPWTDDDGNMAGIVHQERNWTYVLIKGAGHLAGYNNPGPTYTFVREFVFGSNQTGLVSGASVTGGEDSTLAGPAIQGQEGIFVGSGTTQSTYFYPSATIAAWNSFIATAVPTPTPASSSGTKKNGSALRWGAVAGRTAMLGVVIGVLIWSLQ